MFKVHLDSITAVKSINIKRSCIPPLIYIVWANLDSVLFNSDWVHDLFNIKKKNKKNQPCLYNITWNKGHLSLEKLFLLPVYLFVILSINTNK